MSNNKKKLKVFLRVFFVAIVLLALLRSQDMGKVKEIILSVKPLALLVAILIFWFSVTILSLRWYILLKSQKISIPLYSAIKVNFLGLFYNNFLFSSIGGDLLRGWYITHHTTKKLEAAFSVVIDRLIGLLMLVLMAAISLPFVLANSKDKIAVESHKRFDVSTYLHHHRVAIIVALAVILGILIILSLNARFRQYAKKALNKLLSSKTKLLQATKLYIRSPFSVIICMFLTSVAQISTITAIFVLGRAMGIEIPLKYYFAVFPVGWLVSTIPITPGGIGVFELGIVAMFAFVPEGSREIGLALALCQRALNLLGSLPGAVIHLSGAHSPKTKQEFSIDSTDIMN